jgi:hypothetical protein
LSSPERPAQGERELRGTPESAEPPVAEKLKRRRLGKKVTRDEDHKWEVAKQDAWLRELLTDSSGSESEEKYTRFTESGRWIAEMTGSRDKECMGVQEESMEPEVLRQIMSTS